MYDLVANIPHEANTASTGQAVPGTTKKGDKDESETKWKVCCAFSPLAFNSTFKRELMVGVVWGWVGTPPSGIWRR